MTYAGYQQSLKEGREPTPDERAANAAYKRRYRRRNPDRYEVEKEYLRSQNRALWELARRHSEEYRQILEQELDKERGA